MQEVTLSQFIADIIPYGSVAFILWFLVMVIIKKFSKEEE